jgi:hypothetical protein
MTTPENEKSLGHHTQAKKNLNFTSESSITLKINLYSLKLESEQDEKGLNVMNCN